MSPRVLILLIATVYLSPDTIARQAATPIGSYTLVSAGAHELPIFVSHVVRYEGTTIQSGSLELMRGGRMKAAIVVSFTDSGTVTDTILADGQWKAAGGSVRLTYQWSQPRWQGGPRVYQSGRPISGWVSRSELTLAEFAYFNAQFFGSSAPLRFKRVR